MIMLSELATTPGRFGGGEKKRPGIHCWHMRQNVPKISVHRKLLSKSIRIRLRNAQQMLMHRSVKPTAQ